MEINTLLIVEDNPDDVFAYKRYIKLSLEVKQIVVFDLAEKAIDYIEKNSVDCILLDYQLPDMSGLHFIEKLNKVNLFATPPIIMLTGSGSENIAVQALKSGVIDYIIKNEITSDILCKAITNAIEKTKLIKLVQAQADELKQRAYNDYLTGVPNRLRLQELASQSLARAKRNKTKVGIMMIDLDGFKLVNDKIGHDAGDELLKQVVQRLTKIIRENDNIGRFGGDEFVLLLEDINLDYIKSLASRIIKATEKVFKINNQKVFISSSIGIAVYPENGTQLLDLFKKADVALYQAKNTGKGKFYLLNKQ